tara:strand:+ start:1628 stop:2182 length:555 start_codon:yes stop_codon:yes gene_type:complete
MSESNIKNTYKSQIIASSNDNFTIELLTSLDDITAKNILIVSEDLKNIYGPNSILNHSNINKYFNDTTLPFIAKYNNEIIGFIIGAPLENFSNQSWVQFDKNLKKNNTLYTYAFVFKSKFRKIGGFSRTLKKIYISWAKKRNFTFVTGHISKNIFKLKSDLELVKEYPVWYDSNEPFIYYRKKI